MQIKKKQTQTTFLIMSFLAQSVILCVFNAAISSFDLY